MHPDDVARYVRATGPEHDEIQAEMAAYSDEHGFPIIGPDAGAVLRSFARTTGASEVFEFGSGYGYSALWFLKGGADHVVLTEYDEEELEMAESFLERAGYSEQATFEYGDALEAVEGHDGPFDVVLIDHEKSRYVDGFEAVKQKVPEGGVVIADNMMRGPIDFDALVDYFDEGTELPADANEDTRGVAAYIDRVRRDPDFESYVLPVGSGLCVSTRRSSPPGAD